jgi:energy-coupling factor transporter ATP-binding protein EcfA2
MKQLDKPDHMTIDLPMQRMERQAWVEMPLPDLKSFDRFIGWAFGRLLLGSGLFAVCTTEIVLNAGLYCCKWLKGGITKILQTYDSLPYMGVPLQSVVVDTTPKGIAPNFESIDLLESIMGKHLLIIGDTGTGKSTIAQWIAGCNSSQVRVYDPDAAPDEWVGLEVVGRGGNFAAISSGMSADLEEMQSRIEDRATQGDKANIGKDLCLIAEEFPILKDECDIAPEWLAKIARRGRKPRLFIIALSQSDSVQALGIEGDGAIRSNFRYLRLGKFAVAHAKKLKNEALIQWLQSGKYRCMVDDEPCQLPNLKSYPSVTPQLPKTAPTAPVVTPETPTQSGFELNSTTVELDSVSMRNSIKFLLNQGMAESRIIKEFLGYSGSRYQQGKEVFAALTKDK